MTREKRDSSPEQSQSPRLSRRAFLRGSGALAAGILLAGCDIPGIRTDQDTNPPTPEQLVERDFDTYMRQVGNGIITRLGTMEDAQYDPPHTMQDINSPDDYIWRQSVSSGSRYETGSPVGLSVSLENTRNLGYQADGFVVDMTVVSPTSNPESRGKTGYFVQVHARPELSMYAGIQKMIDKGDSVLDIATVIMQQQSGVDVRTSVDLCTLDEDPTDNLGDSVGGEDLSRMDSRGFELAVSAEEKKAVFDKYVTALTPLLKQAKIN